MLRATSWGLYEEVAAEVGLYHVLSLAVGGSGIPAGGSSAHDGQHADAATGQGFASAIGDTAPASPAPPLSTSSLSSPIPEPGADVSTGVLEPFVTDLISSDAEAGPQVESTGIAMQGDVQVETLGASDGAVAPLTGGHRAGGPGLAAFTYAVVVLFCCWPGQRPSTAR